MKFRIPAFAFAAVFTAVLVGMNAQPSAALTLQATAAPTAQPTVDATTSALVRVINASPDAAAIDVFVDKATTASITNLAYTYGTDGYRVITAGAHHITIAASGDPKTVYIDGDVTFDAGTATTVLLQGLASEKSQIVRLLTDDVSDTAGQARLKVSNSIVDGQSLDLVSADFKTTYATGITYGNTFITTLPAGTYDLLLVPTGSTDPKSAVIYATGVNLAADQIYTLLGIGSAKTATSIKALFFTTSPVAGFKAPVIPAATPAATAAS